MRPADRGNLTLNVRREQGRIKVVVDALDKNNEFLNFLQIQRQHRRPRSEIRRRSSWSRPPRGATRRRSRTPRPAATTSSTWAIAAPDKVQGVISSGVSVPYSDEYRELRSNPTTLETLATRDRRPGRHLEADQPTAGSTWPARCGQSTTSAAIRA